MALVFSYNGISRLGMNYAFVRTRSMALTTGMHLGWNYVGICVFSSGTLGNNQLLMPVGSDYGALTQFAIFTQLSLPNI